VSDLVGYARFLECREQRRTADHGHAFPGAIGPARTGIGGPAVSDGAPVEPSSIGARATRAAALAGVAPPRGPVPRWRGRGPTSGS
jgi:hypothetical protein